MTTEHSIKATVAKLQDAWNANDGKAFAAPFVEDAEFTVFDGWQLSGRTAIAKDHEHAFTTVRKGTTSTWTIEKIRQLSDDLAFVIANVIVHNVPTPNGPTEIRTVPRLVLQKAGGEWKIVTLINMIYRPIGDAHHADNR